VTPRSARTLAAVFLVLFAVAVTWPGILPFNRVEPKILGLPFSMVWVALWVTLCALVLWFVDRVEHGGGDR
jgi:uncharacterized membrane protein YidH (DUF202 family)